MDYIDDIFAAPKHDKTVPVMLIDSDTICFRAAAATDGKQYAIDKKAFKYKSDVEKYVKSKGLDPDDIVIEYYPEPISHALGIVKGAINGIGAACQKKFGMKFNMEFFHTSTTNFRDDILPEYKANRIGTRKPSHLKACKDYVARYYTELTEDGLEADDLLGIRSYECHAEGIESAIVTNDKDLKTIPGWNYDWVKGVWTRGTVTEAMKFFYAQTIGGDTADNIPGVSGLGVNSKGTGKAQKIIQKCYEEEMETNGDLPNQELERILYECSLNTWLEGGPGKNGYFGCNSFEEIHSEYEATAKCVFILHERGRLWRPPTAEDSNYS